MSDIVERLRDYRGGDVSVWNIMEEAADTITRLRAEVEQNAIDLEEYKRDVEKLRAALNSLAANTYGYEPDVMSDEEAKNYFAGLFFDAQNKARAALSGDKHDS